MSSTRSRLHKIFRLDVSHHGDNTTKQLDQDAHLQVIGLGLSRTGTTSLQAALVRLGYGPSHQGVDLFRSMPRTEAFRSLNEKLLDGTWKAGDLELTARLRDLMRGYRSTTDAPIDALSDEIYAAFPDAKYILTVRAGREAWWKSFMNAVGWHVRRDWMRYVFRFLISPVTFLRKTDDWVQTHIALFKSKCGGVYDEHVFDKHNAHVRALIPKEKLLVLDVREGWEPLCHFLGVPIPDEPFPALNDTSSTKTIYTGMMLFEACTWILYLGATTGLAYLALRPDARRSIMNLLGSHVS